MITGAIHALRSALNPCRSLETPSAHLTQAMDTLQDRLQNGSAGSAELTKAMERVEAAFTKNDGWKFVKHCFERDVDRGTFVRRLVRNHVSTTHTGFEHVRRTMSEEQLDTHATRLTQALRPQIRAEIIGRLSQAENTGLHVTEGNCIAFGMPGTDLQFSPMAGGFSYLGLALTQDEATQLLLARPEGTVPGTTLLDMMPELTQDHPGTNLRIIRAAIGADGSLLPGLNAQAVHAVAAAAHDALAQTAGSLVDRESMARFFHWMGDDLRVAQSRQIIATIRAEMSPQDNLHSGEIAREGLATVDDVRRFNNARVGENLHRAAYHYARAAHPRQAAEQYLESARVFAEAGDQVMAARNFASAAEKLAACDTFSPIAPVLVQAVDAYGNDFRAVDKLGERCADVLAGRGFHIGAAMVHELVFHTLDHLARNAGNDARAVTTLANAHIGKAASHFAKVGLSVHDGNIPSLIRTAIDARLERFDEVEGLRGDGYTIQFEDKSDVISAEEFNKDAPTEWVLLRRGEAEAPHQVYELMTGVTRDGLISRGSRHPYLQQPLTVSAFIDGVDALDMLTATDLKWVSSEVSGEATSTDRPEAVSDPSLTSPTGTRRAASESGARDVPHAEIRFTTDSTAL